MVVLTRKVFQLATNITRKYHVTVLGGTNEVGQTIALLLRTQPEIKRLVIYDESPTTPGIHLDLMHVPSRSALVCYTGETNLDKALRNADVVIAAGGIQLSPGITENEWFKTNAEFIKTVASKIAKLSPLPILGIVTEPLNSIVPMAAEVMRNNGDYERRKLFGITTVDAMCAQAIWAAENNFNPMECVVPVIGGHSRQTIVPLLSQATPECDISEKKINELVHMIRKDRVTGDTKPRREPTLSIAYGAMVFTRSILDALDGRQAQVNALVENNNFGTGFFSSSVNVTDSGFGEIKRYSNISNAECLLLERSLDQLRKEVFRGKKELELA